MPAGVHSHYPGLVGFPPRNESHEFYEESDEHRRLTTCGGYTTSLPEVIETARAWRHWKNGELSTYLGADEASEELMKRIDLLDSSVGQRDAWLMSRDGREFYASLDSE